MVIVKVKLQIISSKKHLLVQFISIQPTSNRNISRIERPASLSPHEKEGSCYRKV